MPLASITGSITHAVVTHGVIGVIVLMAVDALLPIGGELIMVVAGAIAAGALGAAPTLLGHPLSTGVTSYVVLSLAGVVGSVIGATVGWLLGARAGRDVLDRYGRFVHLGPHRLLRAERWFRRHGPWAVFLGRLTPLVRSFISIPAGLFGEPFVRYSILSAIASAIWCFGFAALGWALGSSYGSVDRVTHVVEVAIVVAVVVLLGVVVLRRRRARSTI